MRQRRLEASGGDQGRQGLPAQSARPSHFHHDAQTGLEPREAQQRLQLRRGEHLSFKQPEQYGALAFKLGAQPWHHTLHFTHGCAAPHALVTEVRGAHAMELQQEGCGIPQASGGGEQGAIAGRPQAAQQARLGSTFEGYIKSQGSRLLKFLAKSAAGEQEGHRNGRTVQGGSLTVPREDWGEGWTLMVYIVCLCCRSAPVR